MEEITLNTFLKNSEYHDKNENAIHTSDSNASTVDDILHSKDGNKSIPMDRMSKCFKELRIQSYLKHNEGNIEHLAGKINNVIETLQIVVVKPCSSDVLLYVGTPLFLICRNVENSKSEYTLLGYIDDIFGSIGEPMYSVTMNCNPKDALNINAHVYYFPNHPNTLHMYVEHTTDKVSNKEKYNIKTKNL